MNSDNNRNVSTNPILLLARRMLANIRARRSLLIVIACVIFSLIFLAEVSFLLACLSYLIILLSAGILPRQGVLRPLVSIKKSPSLQKIETIECQAIIEAMPDPALMLNAHGRVLYMNERARDIFGPMPLQQHLSTFIRDPDFLDAIAKAPRQEEPIEVYYSERVPVERTMHVNIVRFKGARNNAWVPSILVSFHDLTDQGRLNQMRSDFIANVSHELRTPLASVLGFIDTLQGSAKNDPDVQDQFMGIMREQVERMTRLINDLLSLSRVEMAAHITPTDRVDLNEVVEYVVKTLEPLSEELSVSIEVETKLEVADIRGVRDELIQLFQNLLHNALKYGHQGGKISVEIDRFVEKMGDVSTLSISVKDYGEGIAVEHLPRLTERFYRVDTKSSREKGGTGLGLAIVKHIVNRHRGEMKITSKPGEGSTFRILIPEFEQGATTTQDSEF